jgi:enamine deaminase RidA (YjgF/YER057c/UK114 family)
MDTPSARLTALGVDLPAVASPVAVYVPATITGSLIYTAGQLPFVHGALPTTGKLGDGVAVDDGRTLARIAALNALAAAADVAGGIDNISRVVKVTGFVASHPSFTAQAVVIDGASELLGEIFGSAGRHARSAVGVAVLPLDAPVEVELILETRPSASESIR